MKFINHQLKIDQDAFRGTIMELENKITEGNVTQFNSKS